jgi:hypothetical protein
MKSDFMPVAAGGIVGSSVGRDMGRNYLPFGGRRERGAIGGALGGGLTGYALSGGNPYAAALSAVIGGLGGLF